MKNLIVKIKRLLNYQEILPKITVKYRNIKNKAKIKFLNKKYN
jgi:hypothetical protein